jgi:hypothetical protein
MTLQSNQGDLFRRFRRKAREVWQDAKREEIEAALAKVIFDHCDHPPKPRKTRRRHTNKKRRPPVMASAP